MTLIACILSLIFVFSGYYLQPSLGENSVVIFTAAAAIISVIFIVVDIVYYSKKDEMRLRALSREKDELANEREILTVEVGHVKEENSKLYSKLKESAALLEEMDKDCQVKDETIAELNEKITLLLSPKKVTAERTSDTIVSEVPSDIPYEVFCNAVAQCAASSVKSVKSLKRGVEASENPALKKDIDYINNTFEKILYVSTIDKFEANLKPERCALNEIIKDVLRRYSSNFNERKIGIIRKGLELSTVIDKRWFSYGFSQIVYSALCSTGEFGKIAICAKEVEEGILISVEDSSMGLRDDEIENVFSPSFVGIEASRISGNESSMCMYLAKKAFEKIGAEIVVESKYGRGTKVHITLPVSAV